MGVGGTHLERVAPVAKPKYSCGEEQAVNPEPSRSHSNVAPAGLDENANVALEAFTMPDGPASRIVSGGAGTGVPSARKLCK